MSCLPLLSKLRGLIHRSDHSPQECCDHNQQVSTHEQVVEEAFETDTLFLNRKLEKSEDLAENRYRFTPLPKRSYLKTPKPSPPFWETVSKKISQKLAINQRGEYAEYERLPSEEGVCCAKCSNFSRIEKKV